MENDLRLSSLLDEAGFRAKRIGEGSYDVMFASDLREWAVNVRLTDSWLIVRTFVMVAPESKARRVALLDAAMSANAAISLAKFVTNEDRSLCIDLEYRTEHLAPETLKHLVSLLVRVGDDYYPKFFRIVTGDAALEALESAYNKPATEPN